MQIVPGDENIFIGVDPGRSGGICAITQNRRVVACLPMPELIIFADWIEDQTNYGNVFVCLEKAQAMPKQGVSSMFNYGDHFGQLQGVLAALKIPYELVTPQRWGKLLHSGIKQDKDPKQRSLEAAQRLFPTVNLKASERCKKPHLGMVEALLIAEYALRTRRFAHG